MLAETDALLVTPSSSLPCSSMEPHDCPWVKGCEEVMWQLLDQILTRELLALDFPSFSFPQDETWGFLSADNYTREKYPSFLFIPLNLGAFLLQQLSWYLK